MSTASNAAPSAAELHAAFPDERVTHSHVQDVDLPGGAGRFALLTLDNGEDHTRPSTLGPASLTELGLVLDRLRTRAEAGEIVGIGVTGKPFVFAVGADLKGVATITERDHALVIGRLGHQVLGRLHGMPVPTFAFTNGVALGGGVEIGLHCDYRTLSSGVPALALPECFLGLVPGWGGCTLLPRLVGPELALKVILEGPLSNNRMLTGPQAFGLGMADALFEPAAFLEDSLRWAAGVISGEVTVERAPASHDESAWEAAVSAAKQLVDEKTGGAAPAPYRALELVRAARTASREEGFAAEEEALADLLMSDELRAGLYAFDLVQRHAKRPAGAPDRSRARPVTKVGVVGAGLMASQLALLFVRRLKVPVVLTDLDQQRVDQGVAWVHAEIDKLVEKGRLGGDGGNRLRALVSGSTSTESFADADLVIEAVFEELSVKQQVFAEVEQVVSPDCVLATNTSSLSVSAMAAGLRHPERVVGLHFFNPVAVMPLLEVIRGDRTDDATLATGFAAGKALRKSCVLVKDSPSFVVNRLLGRFMAEVGRIVDEGTPLEVADRAFAGLAPMPPFVLIGLVGPTIALHNTETLHEAFPERFPVPESLRRVVAAGKRRYYTQEAGRPRLDPEVVELLPEPVPPVVLHEPQVRDQVLEALAEEARLMLDEGVVASARELDLAMLTGAGFSFWNGGLTPLLDRIGVAERVTGSRFLPGGVASVPPAAAG
ncbi:MAG TPA: 3-hydroxyacyl-CoA dehydrogenase NAD-binding domain-containing protein [Segeticoccus sp.]|uniref:3-hydroxyacyl-CoA dehydrogenase NAD-binding domain-containing protein n=1 Tax=Segeticoccus sp. TaxID=2706531 RepID=UPI002D8000B9|nr:3-hydroxyacyl-CoA dehydrogenase NAD-binding domain-containing protein [Segeticoccus sp.]HET8601408.1 3-hydroxyacyl-CoA dehydrogenase NAD-binding domain-containing protein [Segeticoccus sp.]